MHCNNNIYYKALCLVLVKLLALTVHAQNFSTRGTDFWAGYAPHISMYSIDDGSVTDTSHQNMRLYFSAVKEAKVTVEIPGTGWKRNYTVAANSVGISDTLPKNGIYDSRIAKEGVFNRGIHIYSDAPIAAWCHEYDTTISGASLLIPTTMLGEDYRVLGFYQDSKEEYAHAFCFAIATEDSTLVEVTPSQNTLTHPKGIPFTQMLMKGEVLNLLGETKLAADGISYIGKDLTGTRIKTINSGDTCKRLAVFCGSSKVTIRCGSQGFPSADNFIQQSLPKSFFGKKYFTVPPVKMSNCFFRIMISDTGTIVKINGVVLTNAINNLYYEVQTNLPSLIEANKTVLVAQYFTTINKCNNYSENDYGDPEIIYLLPYNEDINSINIYASPFKSIEEQFINVTLATKDTASFFLDNVQQHAVFKTFSYDTSYAYAQLKIAKGIHHLQCDSGFNAIVYGYGRLESYAYNAGFTNNRNYKELLLHNPYAQTDAMQTCSNTPFRIAVVMPYEPLNMQWNFFNNASLSPHNNISAPNPVADSTFTNDGITYYLYRLPGYYTYSATGNLNILITTAYPTQDGCFNYQQLPYTIDILKKPVANWSLQYNHCALDTLYFKDSSSAYGSSFMQWQWNFGDNTSSIDANPVKNYAQYGDYDVSLRSITKTGCYADTIKKIHLNASPNADFKFSGNDCEKSILQFTDLSQIAAGNIVRWQWDFGDGSNSILQNPSKQYLHGDTFHVRLNAYSDKNCSGIIEKNIIVYSYPIVQGDSDLFVEEGNTITIHPAYYGKIIQYMWSPSSYLSTINLPYTTAHPPDDIIYTLRATGEGDCITTKLFYIDIIQLLKIPNAFSPNNDGINDSWVIGNIYKYPQASVEIFNRYGQRVFYSEGYGTAWDGKYKGKPLPIGTYYYIINTRNKHMPLQSGNLTLLR